MNYEMMPEPGDSSQVERTADELMGKEIDPSKELSADQISELCFKIIDVTGGEGNLVEYEKNGLYVEARYYHELDDEDQPYEVVYSVLERRVDSVRNDGKFYNTKSYQIVFETGVDVAQFADVETFYEMYDEGEQQIVRVEEDNPGTTPEDRLRRSIDAYGDKEKLGLSRPLNQGDYANLMRLLALAQQ